MLIVRKVILAMMNVLLFILPLFLASYGMEGIIHFNSNTDKYLCWFCVHNSHCCMDTSIHHTHLLCLHIKKHYQHVLKPLYKENYCAGYTENCDEECVSSCKPYWTEIDSHCYLWSKIQLSWAEAEGACRKEGGHLASIASKATNDKISNETKTNHRGHTSMWIGGTDTEEEGVWR